MNNFNEPINEDHTSDKKHDKKGKGFFIINLSVIVRIVEQGGQFDEVASYLVLARGAGRARKFSTHGANSISVRAGLSNSKAERALEWLIEKGIIQKVENDQNKPKARLFRYELIELHDVQVVDVPLSNDLLDGVGVGKNYPPLTRINYEVELGEDCDISHSKLDALVLLLFLYKYHEIADFGGVNPNSGLYREYFSSENSNGNEIENIEGSNAALYEIEGSEEVVCGSIDKEAFFYILDNLQRVQRIFNAFFNLKRLGFLYEVIAIWNEDPIKNMRAYPLYTLYIFDRHARVNEPYLSSEIHKAAIRRKTLDGYEEFSGVDDFGSANIIKTGRFRYVAHQKNGGYPIGIFRLRFRPWTRDCGRGIDEEKNRFNRWSAILDKF